MEKMFIRVDCLGGPLLTPQDVRRKRFSSGTYYELTIPSIFGLGKEITLLESRFKYEVSRGIFIRLQSERNFGVEAEGKRVGIRRRSEGTSKEGSHVETGVREQGKFVEDFNIIEKRLTSKNSRNNLCSLINHRRIPVLKYGSKS